MRSGEAARQAAADEEVLERIEAQILERCQQYCSADYLVDCLEEEGAACANAVTLSPEAGHAS